MKTKRFHLLFVCVSNRGRSPFAEFFFPKIINELDSDFADRIHVTSAGFIPRAIRDHVAKLQIGFPEPFYDRPMPETTRSFLSARGIAVPRDWRSRELTAAMVEDADLIITAIPPQKEDLFKLYPEARAKIFTIREISRWDGRLRFEDFTGLPSDNTYWNFVEEDPDYVKEILTEMEESLKRALEHVLGQLGRVESIKV